jgi:hypothetical protein
MLAGYSDWNHASIFSGGNRLLSFIGFRVFLGLPQLLFKGNAVCFTRCKAARAVKVITYLHLVPNSRTRSSLFPLLIAPS